MVNRLKLSAIIFSIAAILALNCPVVAATVVKTPVPGVTLSQDISVNPALPQIVTVISVDLADPTLNLQAVLGKNYICNAEPNKGREIVSSMVGRKDAIAGVNADYFPFTGDPLGMCIVNGELVSEPTLNRVVMGITKSKSIFFDNPKLDAKMTFANGVSRQIDGINRLRDTNQVILYTEIFGATTLNTKYRGTEVVFTTSDLPVQVGKTLSLTVTEVRTDALDTPIPKGGVVMSGGGAAGSFLKENLKPGDVVQVCLDIKSESGVDWKTADQAVGGGPWLLKNSAEFVDAEAEGFPIAFSTTAHPRTAVGVTADNKLLMVTVDGRQDFSQGRSLRDMSALMKKLGAVNAINLDGGGSTTMSMKGLVVNSPSEGVERSVADALIVMTQTKQDELPKLTITGIDKEIVAGTPTKLALKFGDDQQPLLPAQLDQVVWGQTGGIGFVDQSGNFTPITARKGAVKALLGTQVVSLDIIVAAAAPQKMTAKSTPDGMNPLRYGITATLVDAYGNPVPGIELKLAAVGGELEAQTGTTDAKGEFFTNVTLDPDASGRYVTINADTLNARLQFKDSAPAKPAVVPLEQKLSAKIESEAKNTQRCKITATLQDSAGKPLPGRHLTLSVTDGKSDAIRGITNIKGEFCTNITWNPNTENRTATLTVGTITLTVPYMEK